MKRSAAEIAALARLIDTALELPPGERDTWIDQLPSDHDTLKPALRKLLATPPAGNSTFTLADISEQVQAARLDLVQHVVGSVDIEIRRRDRDRREHGGGILRVEQTLIVRGR